MSNQSYDDRQQGYNREYRDRQRQPQQFQDERGGQFGEGAHYGNRSPDYRDDDYDEQYDNRGYGRSDPFYGDRDNNRNQSGRGISDQDDTLSGRAYDNGRSGRRRYGTAVNTGPRQRGYDESYSNGTGYRSDGYRENSRFNRDQYDRDQHSRGYNDDRGFFDKAGDEVASWFGDDAAERRRVRDHRGKGPANYKRSNERLLEDACERLTHSSHVDASQINVTAKDNEITLDGTVQDRREKRGAEDCVHDISGVKHVQNNLRIADRDEYAADTTSGNRKGTKKS